MQKKSIAGRKLLSYSPWLKRLLIMKMIAILILVVGLTSSYAESDAQTAKVNLKFTNGTVKDVLEEIEHQTNLSFMYDNDVFKVNRQISIEAENETLKSVVDKLISGENLKYEMVNRYIVITSAKELPANQQDKKLTGKVTDSTGGSLPGVSVVVKGTTTGVITDNNGNYSLINITDNAILQFSFVGMKSQELTINGKTVINVALAEDAINIDEVVAIGYGVQKKKLLTGATLQIAGEDIQKQSTISPLTAMQSQSPGISITQNSGKPGSDFKINIRGLGTIGNASPLVIIDNVAGGDLNSLNPGDIESIDVLKDAASAAIYGARAANGVILIKTKQGKKGKPRISYDSYFGIQNVAKYVDVLNAPQYIDMENESYKNAGSAIPNWAAIVPEYAKIQQGWKGTNWQKEFTHKNAQVQNHTINLTGGSDYSTFSLGASYTSQEAVYGQPASPVYNNYSFRLNSEHILYKNNDFDIIKIGENLLYTGIVQNNNGMATGNMSYNDIRNVVGMHPLMSVYDANGDFTKAMTSWADAVNPIGLYTLARSNNDAKSYSIRVNPYIEIQPVKGLIFKSNFGYKYYATENRSYMPAYNLGGKSIETLDRVNQSMISSYSYTIENTINYKTSINNAHNINALLGQSVEANGFGASISGSNRGSIFDSFDYAYLNNVKTLNTSNLSINGSPNGRSSISSVFGRVNYDYKEKYLASVIMRADGSSNFAKGKQWGYFPSAAAGWLVSEESFMKSSRRVVDYLKVRASWGQNGNQSIAPFQYMSTYSFTGGDYYFGTSKASPSVGAYPSILPNKDVTWETSEQLNIGADSRFFNSRLAFNFDWYTKKTNNWLIQAPVPAVWGAAAPYINGGDVENKGVEMVLSWSDKIGQLTYSISGNVAFNKNKVTRIANAQGLIEGATTVFSTADRTSFYRAQVGYPIGYFYGYKTAGVFQNQAQIDGYKGGKLATAKPGDLIYVDTDGNGTITSNDKTMIGDPNPDAIFGLNISLGYKGFDFSLSANGVAGNQIASNLRPAENLYGNWPTQYLGRWHGEGTSNRYPILNNANTSNWGWNSDIYVDNGDFLRIQNITLGYDFKKLIPKMLLGQARIYFAASNLFTFTRYYGADPEIGYANDGWSKGIDLGFYPRPRTFMVGVNLKF